MKHHPDKNSDDSEIFKQISHAYDVLGDPDKRQQYDVTGDENLQQQGNPFGGFSGFGGGGNPFGFSMNDDIFQHIFNQQNQQNQSVNRKGKPKEINIDISLIEAYTGIKKQIKITSINKCIDCYSVCSQCNGQGVTIRINNIGSMIIQNQVHCNMCNATGIVSKNNKCTKCNGKKQTENIKNINLDIAAGVNNGMKIVLQDHGDSNIQIINNKLTLSSSDLLLNLVVNNSFNNYNRIDNNLIYTYNISYYDLLINPEFIEIKDLVNNNIKLDFIDPINHKKEYIFDNKGMPIYNCQNKFGNLIIKFDVNFPNKKLNEVDKQKIFNLLTELKLK